MGSGHIHHRGPFDYRLDIPPCNGPAAVGSLGVGSVHHSSHREDHVEAGSHGRNGQNPLMDPRWAAESVRVMAPEDNLGDVVGQSGGGAVLFLRQRGDVKVGGRY